MELHFIATYLAASVSPDIRFVPVCLLLFVYVRLFLSLYSSDTN